VSSSHAVERSLGVLAGSQCRRIGLAIPPRPWQDARPSASAAGPRGSTGLPAVGNAVTRTDNPPTELRPLQSMTAAGCRTLETRVARQPLNEVRGSFSTVHLASPPDPGLPHPVRSACGVSHPLDGLLLARLPGLVSCRSAHGVPTLQSVPLARSSSASRRPMPSCRWPPSNAARTRGSDSDSVSNHAARQPDSRIESPPVHGHLGAYETGSTSGPCSPGRVRCTTAAVRPTAGPMLSWASNLVKATLPKPRADASDGPPPSSVHRWHREGNPKEPDADWPACSTED
jgi:hypothetical protein